VSVDSLFQGRVIRITIDFPGIRVDRPNIYLIKSRDGYSMIDCGGYDLESDLPLLGSLIREAGIDIGDIKEIFLTHTHKDHAFLVSKVQSITGARVYMGRDDYYRLSDNLTAYQEFFSRIEAYLSYWGFRQDMVDRFFRSFNRQYYNAGLDVTAITFVERDMRLSEFDILFTPGHTRGSICLYHRESGLLFTGDTLMKKIVSVPIIEYSGSLTTSMLTEHTETLRKLREIRCTAILPGHGDVITDEKGVIDAIFAYIERRAKRVESLIREGLNDVYSLAHSLYGRDVLYDVVCREEPTVYVSDLMMPLEYLFGQNRIRVEDGRIKLLD